MNEKHTRGRLVEHGEALFGAPKRLIPFTTVPEADALLKTLPPIKAVDSDSD
jgi:hypothetical protein